MDATSEIQKLADELLQVPEPTTEGTTAEAPEIVEETVEEPTQETEGEELQVNDEVVDEDPTDSIEFDGDDDDLDLTEVAELDYDTLIPVKINGKEEQWTISKLQQSAAGQGYIQKGMQEVAALKKQYTQSLQQIAQQREQDAAFFQDLKANGLQEPTPPSRQQFDEDPIGYMHQKLEYDQAKAEYDQKVAQVQQMQQQQTQAREAQLQEYTQEQARLLTERLPELADPQKGEAIKKGLMEAGDYYGFTETELGSVRDHRYIMAMYDAMRYRQLVNKRGKATSKSESLPPVKAGTKKRVNSGKAAARKKAEARLQKEGSIDAALDVLLQGNQR